MNCMTCMTFNYNRPMRGFPPSHGRRGGRHGGGVAVPAVNKWVRPGWKGKHDEEGSTCDDRKSHQQPILKGPKVPRHARDSRPVSRATSRVWKRSEGDGNDGTGLKLEAPNPTEGGQHFAQASESTVVGMMSKGDMECQEDMEKCSGDVSTFKCIQYENSPTTIPPNTKETTQPLPWRRTGKHKLVRSNSVDPPRDEAKKEPFPVSFRNNKLVMNSNNQSTIRESSGRLDSKPPSQSDSAIRRLESVLSSKQDGEGTTIRKVDAKMKMEKQNDTGASSSHARHGSNKLVLTTKSQRSNSTVDAAVTAHSEVSSSKEGTVPQKGSLGVDNKFMRKMGQNKLELAVSANDKKASRKRPHDDVFRGSRNRGGSKARRVQLVEVSNELNGDGRGEAEQEGEGSDGDFPGNKSPVSTATAQKLTDFAYRETSVKRPHRRGRHANIKTHMGLTRVQPNVGTTPICPTFLRGVACTNPKCTKRHDIPKEAATPICSFFQRNGMCLRRESCPFRHIKVNPQAAICPSFAMLGFCDDKDCLMKHIRSTALQSKETTATLSPGGNSGDKQTK